PADVYRAPPGQKILIDTKKPALQLSAERSPAGDEVMVTYSIQEERPERESLRLEYRAADAPGGQWTPLPVRGFSERGNLSFRPRTPGAVTVRLSLRDQAQNEASEEKVVPGMKVDQAVRMASGNTDVHPAPTPP